MIRIKNTSLENTAQPFKMLLKIFIFTSLHSFIWKQDNYPLPVGLLAQLALYRHREGNGYKSFTGLNYFQALYSLLPK